MIAANELRLGNWVNYNNTICVIACIENDGGMDGSVKLYPVNIPKGTVVCVKTVSTSNIQSIPLTEEILLKCGFEKITNVVTQKSHWSFKRKRNEMLSKPAISIYENRTSVGNDTTVNHVLYLHQLQNLYFALTGK